MAKRSYGEFCGLARTLDVVGDRWTLLVVRELLYGPKRFTDLMAGLPGIATNLLAQRLREVEEAGIVERSVLPPPAASAVYQLTDRGRGLHPALVDLTRWSLATMELPAPTELFRTDWLLLALEAAFLTERASEAAMVVELLVAGEPFRLRIADGRLAVERGSARRPDLVLAATARELLGLVMGSPTTRQALLARGAVRVEGKVEALARFLEVFGHPSGEQADSADWDP
jgi:DNA-binding HxlR family transcriptional regulator